MLGPTASGEPAARLAGWHLSIRLLRLGLLTRPFNAATGIDGLRRRHLRLLLPHFLNALSGYLVKSVILHRRDQELGQPPYQSIDTVWRVAGARPIEIAREGAHLVLQLGERRRCCGPCPVPYSAETGSARATFPRLAQTVVTGTLLSTIRIVASTMASPLLRSATMRSEPVAQAPKPG